MSKRAQLFKRAFRLPNTAARVARANGIPNVLKLTLDDGTPIFVPFGPRDGKPFSTGGGGAFGVAPLPDEVIETLGAFAEDFRRSARMGVMSGVPVLLGVLLGLMFDSSFPGRGYGPALGAVLGNAVGNAAMTAGAGGDAAAVARTFAGSALPVAPLLMFGFGKTLDAVDDSGRGQVALGSVALMGWALADKKLIEMAGG